MPLTSSFASDPDLFGHLEYLAKVNALADKRFPARNCLLECEIPKARVDDYAATPRDPSHVGVDPESAFTDYVKSHKKYLGSEVHIGVRATSFSATSGPHTFRPGKQIGAYTCPGDEEFLLRLEQLDFMESHAALDPPLTDVYELLGRVGEANQGRAGLSTQDRNDCAELLKAWQAKSDARPFYATFWSDAAGALSSASWPDELRDRLGLVHYDPSAYSPTAIRVVLFKYAVRRVPESGRPLLVRPTVLDGSMNYALYTAAPGSGVGWAVDLDAGGRDLWREVVHPAITFTEGEVWAVGEISAPLSQPMDRARRDHSHALIAEAPGSDFAQLCDDIDGDL